MLLDTPAARDALLTYSNAQGVISPQLYRRLAAAAWWQLDAGGYSLLRRGAVFALLRYPRFRFRPSQADALQVDLWLGGINHLRDAGSYSYNRGEEAIRYFGGTAGHNTIQFDDRDQMPRLSR